MIYKRSSHLSIYLNFILYALLLIYLQTIHILINSKVPSLVLVEAINSINYGITQPAITDINQLMPKLCQNQSVICEGSFCIPNIRRCVCDLRMPVQFGRFCLRQVDIETKCFATSQCNHTIKDAVCLDVNSNAILDGDSSKFKLDQWQQLNELRQTSQSSSTNKADGPESTVTEKAKKNISTARRIQDSSNLEFQNNVIYSNARNSPYEINYNTPELLLQNHTRRRTNNSDRSIIESMNSGTFSPFRESRVEEVMVTSSTVSGSSLVKTLSSTIASNSVIVSTTTHTGVTERSNAISTTATYGEQASKKKMIIRAPNWPPGLCSCPIGFMFDSMLRKCLALSLADSHCQVDSDCKQIAKTHCSSDSKKCDCDEPLEWNQKEMACLRPKPTVQTDPSSVEKENSGIMDTTLILAKFLPDYLAILILFVVLIIIGTLILLRLTVKCFSSSSSALISPKTKKKKPMTNNLPPKSPYATLRRPEHKPSSQLSNFAQVTRGRILNYDFEEGDETASSKPQQASQKSGKSSEKVGTFKATSHKHQQERSSKSPMNVDVDVGNQVIELNDNISVSQMESESKSDNSILTIPGPSPNQQPPYMLASAMKGQGSAIAAAAAAVANKRMQLAQKKNLEQQQASRHSGKDPVFL